MLNRRHLRIKVLQALYAYFQSNEDNYVKSEEEMLKAIEKIFDLYLFLLLTFEELKSFADRKIEENKKKIRPTAEELNPNLKFVDNAIFKILEESKQLRLFSEEHKVNWIGDDRQELLRKMFLQVRDSETYFEFMNNGESGFEEDRQFATSLFKTEIANFPLLHDFLEELSIQWIDDIDLACTMVLKTIKNFKDKDENSVLTLYKDKEDEIGFVKNLFRKTISMDKENEQLINELTQNWEFDRIAKMDLILMKMAITELQIFNEIPTKVTLNEYIEISKFYSTPKSNTFINGILDKAIILLKDQMKIQKVGRGLMG